MPKIERIIDLTAVLGPQTRVFPGIKPLEMEHPKTHEVNGVQTTRMALTVHGGTHMDAPLHFIAGANDISQVRLERVCGRALVLDLSGIAPGSAISPADFEQADPGLQPGDIAILNTGYEHCPELEKYCYLTREAARWLVDKKIKCLAMDILSVDPVHKGPQPAGDQTHPAHHALLGSGVILVECMVNLDALPSGPLFFVCLPLPIEESEGSPARAVVMEFE